MSLTSALSSAMSGLGAASRGSEIVSNNISNANTPGYARRTLEISSNGTGTGTGVRIDGIVRHVDQQVLNDRRLAEAEYGYRSDTTAALTEIEDLVGTPDTQGSLSARLADFEQSLITAASRPDASERLNSAAYAAKDLVASVNSVSDGIQDIRTRADNSIAAQVNRLNDALKGVQKLNSQITASNARNSDVSALQDERQRLIDEISEIVPARVIERDHGQVALYSTGGAILLEGRAVEIEFEQTNVVTPYASIDDGTLSGLTIDGFAINTTSGTGRLHGGTLGAQFEIRDEIAPAAQAEIDAFARDLIERFEDPSIDPSLTVGDPGLFTDNGASLVPTADQGLASRLELNALVDPSETAETWRLRDGLGAAAPGNEGDATLLTALNSALADSRISGSGTVAHTAQSFIAGLTSQLGADRLREEQFLSFASAQFTQLTEMELANGVDTDVEIQNLMILEQAYAANAKVIETVDEMLDALLRI
ncbi:MAG: flagellar hook-associated protein FlgK [Pseudomonadota bacterium]